jgi:hypothetical protein
MQVFQECTGGVLSKLGEGSVELAQRCVGKFRALAAAEHNDIEP